MNLFLNLFLIFLILNNCQSTKDECKELNFILNLVLILIKLLNLIFIQFQTGVEDPINGTYKLELSVINGELINLPEYLLELKRSKEGYFKLTTRSKNTFEGNLIEVPNEKRTYRLQVTSNTSIETKGQEAIEEQIYFSQLRTLNFFQSYSNFQQIYFKSPTGVLYFRRNKFN